VTESVGQSCVFSISSSQAMLLRQWAGGVTGVCQMPVRSSLFQSVRQLYST